MPFDSENEKNLNSSHGQSNDAGKIPKKISPLCANQNVCWSEIRTDQEVVETSARTCCDRGAD